MIQIILNFVSYLMALILIAWLLMMSAFFIDVCWHGSMQSLQQLEQRAVNNDQLRPILSKRINTLLRSWKDIQRDMNIWVSEHLPSLLTITRFFEVVISALALTFLIVLHRCLLLIVYLPLLLIGMLTAAIDGLSQRYIRTACLARESSARHETARRTLKSTLLISGILWISIPFELSAEFYFAIAVMLLSVMSFFVCQSYKKYY